MTPPGYSTPFYDAAAQAKSLDAHEKRLCLHPPAHELALFNEILPHLGITQPWRRRDLGNEPSMNCMTAVLLKNVSFF